MRMRNEMRRNLLPLRKSITAEHIIKDWFQFCRLNPGFSRSTTLHMYVTQMLSSGMMHSSIKSRLETLTHISHDPTKEADSLDRLHSRNIVSTINGLAAATRGTGKPNLALHNLIRPLVPQAQDVRNQTYQCLWAVLVVTGCRPRHLKYANVIPTSQGLEVCQRHPHITRAGSHVEGAKKAEQGHQPSPSLPIRVDMQPNELKLCRPPQHHQ